MDSPLLFPKSGNINQTAMVYSDSACFMSSEYNNRFSTREISTRSSMYYCYLFLRIYYSNRHVVVIALSLIQGFA